MKLSYYYFGDLSSIIKDLLNMQQKEQIWKDMLSNMEAYSKFNKYDDCNNVTMDVTIDNKTVSFRMTKTDSFKKIKLNLDVERSCKNNLDFKVVYQPHDNVLQNQSGTIGLISLNELSKLNQIDLDEMIEFIKLKNTGFVFGIQDDYFVQLQSEIIFTPELVKLYNDIFDDSDNDYIYVTKSIHKTYHYLILSKKSEHKVIVRCST